MSGHNRPDRRYVELAPDADAMTRLSRALEVARRRLRYRIGAALIVAATVVVALLVLVR
ncbi:MAG TPA: hypothetical protein VNV17_25335 [Solirubrobacteraceae bacterium]|jgi:hypothetical protein|nr:hypothetical protein [Solirubrobacteraceae bacterium]